MSQATAFLSYTRTDDEFHGERQMFDWRSRADVPLDQPDARRSIVELAGQFVERLADLSLKTHSSPAVSSTGSQLDALADDPQLASGVVSNLKRTPPQVRMVLWVDDRPADNVWERKALASYGVQFVLALDTAEDESGGMTLLKWIRGKKIDTPYFIYTAGRTATLLRPVTHLRGAQGITADPDALVDMVVAATR